MWRRQDVKAHRIAGVTRWIARHHVQRGFVVLRWGQGHGELPLRIGHGCAQHHVTRASDRNGSTCFGGAGQRRTAGDDLADHRRVRRVSIDDHADRAAFAGVARRVARYHGDGMRIIGQRRADRQREGPLPLLVDLYLAERIAVNGDGNGA